MAVENGRLRVVLTIGQLQVGGAEGQVVMLAKRLHAAGAAVFVAALFDGGPHVMELQRIGVSVYLGGFPRVRRDGHVRGALLAPIAFVRLVRWLRTVRPHVVHAFLFHAYVVTPFAARLARVPIVVQGRRSLADFKAGRRGALLLERASVRLTDLLVANADAVAGEVARGEGVPSAKIVVIRNGLDLSLFADAPPPRFAEPVRILCVANLRPYKGHDVLIEAAHRVAARGGPAFRVMLAGEGTLQETLSRQAANGPARIEFLGPRRDVPQLLADADLVVLPSRTEGLSNAILEAMAAGRPIIATDVGGNREALNGCGVIVPAGDPEALAAAIARLLRDPSYARALGAAAQGMASQRYSAEAMGDAHLCLYRSLVATRRPR